MNLEVRKYKNKDEIIINCFDTWTNSLQNLIKDNYDTIEKYRRKEKEIFELKEQYKRENKVYNIFDLRNEYYDTICDLKEKFQSDIIEYAANPELEALDFEEYGIKAPHGYLFYGPPGCGKTYTDKEKDRIYKYGLKTSSKDNLLDRIQNLLNDGYIDEKESEFLKEHHLLIKQDNMRENQLWVTLGNVNISYSVDSGLFNFYDNYGGEIQYFCIENSALGDKLNNLSKPYLIVLKLYPTQIVEYGLSILLDNIFNRINFENSEQVEYEFYTDEKNVLIEDMIEIDINSKIII